MWHQISAKSFWDRVVKICLLSTIFFCSPDICAQNSYKISPEDQRYKDQTLEAFERVAAIHDQKKHYAEAARILAANRKLIEGRPVWDDPWLRQKTMAIQWFMEGRTAKFLNQFEQARNFLARAKEHFQILEDQDRPNSNMINVLGDLGTLHGSIGELEDSERYHKLSLEKVSQYLRDSVNKIHPIDSAFPFSGLGNIYLEKSTANRGYLEAENMADLRNARSYFEKSLQIRLADSSKSPDYEKIALSCENLALCLLRMDSLDRAMQYADQARRYLKQAEDTDRNEISYLNMLYGEIFMRKGEYVRAEAEFRAAFKIRNQSKYKFPPFLYGPLNGMAQAAEKQNDLARALQLCERAYQLFATAPATETEIRDLPFKAPKIDVLSTKAHILSRMGRKQEALSTYFAIADLAANLRGEAPTEQAQFHTSGNDLVLNAHCEGIHLALELYKMTKNTAFFDQAFELSERSKAVVLLESFRKNQFLQHSIRGMDEKEAIPFIKLQQQDMEISRLKRIQGNERNLKLASDLGDTIMRLQRQYQISLQSLKKNYQGKFPAILRAFEHQSTISPVQVQQQILSKDSSQAMISYTLCRGRLSVLLLTAERRHAVEVDLDDAFHQKLKTLIGMLRTQGGHLQNEAADFQRISQSIYQVLVAPYMEWLDEQGIRRLIVIPDGQLSYLSFDALLKPGPPKNTFRALKNDFLTWRFYLSYEYSATILKERQDRHRSLKSNRVGVFAPNRFAGAIDLPKNSKAAMQICRATSGISYEYQEATRAHFLAGTDSFNVIIAATHSIADDQHPANSVMLLADPNNPEQNDSLFAYEFYHSPLHVNHLFLASCETGMGKLRRGEGVLSLARGITAAGCASATVSLWKVAEDSVTTGDIMWYYFENLAQNIDKDIALGEAKRKFLSGDHEEGDWPYRPYFWAELIITGDTAPTPMPWQENRDFRLVHVLILAAILLLGGWMLSRWWRKKRGSR